MVVWNLTHYWPLAHAKHPDILYRCASGETFFYAFNVQDNMHKILMELETVTSDMGVRAHGATYTYAYGRLTHCGGMT
jgi:hypothetical protein